MVGLDEAVAVVAFVGFVDECIKFITRPLHSFDDCWLIPFTRYGRALVQKFHSYRHAVEETTGFVVAYESIWIKTEAQIDFLHFKEMQKLVLLELQHILKTTNVMVDRYINREDENKKLDISEKIEALKKMTTAKKLPYAARKKSLETVIDDLEKWQSRYDPTWVMVIKISGPIIDDQLRAEATKSDKNDFIMAAKRIRDAVRANLELPPQEQQSVLISPQELTHPLLSIEYSSVSSTKLRIGEVEADVLVDRVICDPQAA